MDWYVIQAYSGYEQKVKAALEERIALNGLSEKFGEILIPTEQIVELKSGEKKTTERKFFPGYILIHMNLEDDSWQLVQSTPRVSGFIGGTRDKPLPISEEDVNNIINRIEVGEDAPAPKTMYEPGEVIRVCDGPFNDFNGVVENVDYERNIGSAEGAKEDEAEKILKTVSSLNKEKTDGLNLLLPEKEEEKKEGEEEGGDDSTLTKKIS